MKILIKGATGKGWYYYTVEGTRRKPRNKELIEILDGNPKLGDLISNQGNWKENEYQIVLAFKGKPPKKVVREATKFFKKHFMAGFKEDEYHFDAVAHYDTDDTHVHIRIPKLNLRTGTQLQLYYHKKDVDRVNLIRDHINYELDLDVSVNEKPLIAEDADMKRIQKWREESGQEPFEFDTRKNREKAKLMIALAIKAEHENASIESLEDLRSFFSERYSQYSIVNEGYDKSKNFHYFTIQNQKEEKLRLDGEFYSEAFWQKTRELRLDQFANNKQETKPIEKKVDVAAKLEMATQKRIEEIEAKYKKARARVGQELGRERARQRKFELKKEAEEKADDINGRSNQATRSGISTGEVGERARERSIEEGVCLSVAELITNSFSVDTGRSNEAGERRSSEASRAVVDPFGIEDTSGRGDSITVADSYTELRESIRQLESTISTFADEVEDCLEAIGIEAETEQFGNIIGDKIRDFKAGINEWVGTQLEETRRAVERRLEEFGNKIQRKINELGEQAERWLENAPMRLARAGIKRMKAENKSKNMVDNLKPKLG